MHWGNDMVENPIVRPEFRYSSEKIPVTSLTLPNNTADSPFFLVQ
jgi:hypothetical protein